MKRFILPLALVVFGVVLLIPFKIISDDPSLTQVTEPVCTFSNSGAECYQRLPNKLTENIAKGSLAMGVVTIPSGVAIGIYRLVQMKRLKLSKK